MSDAVDPTMGESVEDSDAKLRAAIKRLSDARKMASFSESEEKDARRELLALLQDQGLPSYSDGANTVRIKHRQITDPIVPHSLRTEIGDERANLYIQEHVDESRLLKDLPYLREKLIHTMKTIEYVELSGPIEYRPA